MDIHPLYNELLSRLSKDLKILPDKSEENAANTLAALWHKAAGEALSPVAAEKKTLTALQAEQVEQFLWFQHVGILTCVARQRHCLTLINVRP